MKLSHLYNISEMSIKCLASHFLSDCAQVVLEIEKCVLRIDIREASVVDRGRNISFAASSSDRWHKQQQQ